MNKWLAIVAALLSVAGCSQFSFGTSTMNPQTPKVTVVRDRHIVIDQEPVIAQRGSTITWQLSADAKAQFISERGITIDALVKDPAGQRTAVPPGTFTCKGGEREFSCVVSRNAKLGQYAYTVRLKGAKGDLILDPTVIVEE